MNELGELRPSQLIFTFGIGSLVDLPNMSAIVLGLDDWDTRYCQDVEEDRLVAAVEHSDGVVAEPAQHPPQPGRVHPLLLVVGDDLLRRIDAEAAEQRGRRLR